MTKQGGATPGRRDHAPAKRPILDATGWKRAHPAADPQTTAPRALPAQTLEWAGLKAAEARCVPLSPT